MLYQKESEAGSSKPTQSMVKSFKGSIRAWHWLLKNKDTGDVFESQFPSEGTSLSGISGTWNESFTLNRSDPIVQFIHGNSERVTVSGKLFSENKDVDIFPKFDTLRTWAKKDQKTGRPPVLTFTLGRGDYAIDSCVLEEVGNVELKDIKADGSFRSIEFSVTLREYVPYSLESKPEGNTRYHRSKFHDYYEWLCVREYGDPSLGDVIRRDHPTKPNIQVGDVITLPAVTKLRNKILSPKSIALQTAFGRKDTPQRTLRYEYFLNRNQKYTSHVLVE